MGIFDRQKTLKLDIPKRVGVIGVGGTGSWVAANLALVGVPEIVLIDHDIVEIHNLNRTLFSLDDVGMKKVDAIAMFISFRRTTTVFPFAKRTEDLSEPELNETLKCDYVIDCRDVTDILPEGITKKVFAKLGYDGEHVTLHFKPKYGAIWGEDAPGYEIVPSFLIPPQFAACLVTHALVKRPKKPFKGIVSLHFDELWEKLFDLKNKGGDKSGKKQKKEGK